MRASSPDHADALVRALTELMVERVVPVPQSGTFHWG